VLAVGAQRQRSAKAQHARRLLGAYRDMRAGAPPDAPLAHYAELLLQARPADAPRRRWAACSACPCAARRLQRCRAHPPRCACRRLRLVLPAGHGLTGASRQARLEQQTPAVSMQNAHLMSMDCGPSVP
jgi:hypothetical protein